MNQQTKAIMTAEKLYHNLGDGYGYNGHKEDALKMITQRDKDRDAELLKEVTRLRDEASARYSATESVEVEIMCNAQVMAYTKVIQLINDRGL